MKVLANAALAAGIGSLVIGVILRLLARPIMLGLEPSSFLIFTSACFLLTIAINTMAQK